MTAAHTPFSRTMSLTVHELRTPMTVVSGYLRMLLKEQGGPLTDKQRKMLEEAERSCSRISTLVNEMSDLGKLEAGEVALGRQEVDVASVLTALAADMHEGHDRGVSLEIRGAERPLVVVGDRARLDATLRSLVHASLRERGEPGVIVAECSMSSTPPPSVVIAIGDDETRRALAEPPNGEPSFDEFRGGMGLALPIAGRMIAAHGGRLWSASGGRPRAGCALQLPLKT